MKIQDTTTATQGLPCLERPRLTSTNKLPRMSSRASASVGGTFSKCKVVKLVF